MNYFGNYKRLGLNADLDRHRNEEKRLRDLAEKYEKEGDEERAAIYRSFLSKLLVSKAHVTEKLMSEWKRRK